MYHQKQIGKFWDLARQTPAGYQSYAKQVSKLFYAKAPILEQLLDLLFYIAKSDGEISEPEKKYLEEVANIFGFNSREFERLLTLHQGGVPSALDILGVSEDVDDETLTKRWKELVRTHHPDTLTAEGMPKEFVAAANERLAKINAAYDTVSRQRGI